MNFAEWINVLISVGIPIALLAAGVLGRKIVRGKGWRASDWFLGVESSLAALTSAMINISDEAAKISDTTPFKAIKGTLAWNAVFIVLSLILFLFVLSTHQDHEKDDPDAEYSTADICWLAGFSNVIGLGLLACFLLWIKV
jgi:hypothetical protein